MKKISLVLMICAALVSCRKSPSISVNHDCFDCTTEGQTFNVNITATGQWTVSAPDYVEVYPKSASGNSPASITVPFNDSWDERTITVIFTSSGRGGDSDTQVTIRQAFVMPEPEMNVEVEKSDYDFSGGWVKATVTANYGWSAVVTYPEAPEGYSAEVTSSGETGESVLLVGFGTNTEDKAFDVNLTVTCEDPMGRKVLKNLTFPVTAPFAEKGGVNYDLVYMQDGRFWMAENLRYIPQGASPSDELLNAPSGIWYPVDLSTKAFAKDEEDIISNGYLYNAEAAFGIPQGTLTRDNYQNYEGVQGLCPDGWHIPTATELLALVGKAAGQTTNPDAPYYNSVTDKCYIADLNEDGFNIPADTWGMVTVTTKFMVQNIMSYIWGSTGKPGDKGFYDATATLPAYAFFISLMPSKTLTTCNGADSKSINGACIRCIKDLREPLE